MKCLECLGSTCHATFPKGIRNLVTSGKVESQLVNPRIWKESERPSLLKLSGHGIPKFLFRPPKRYSLPQQKLGEPYPRNLGNLILFIVATDEKNNTRNKGLQTTTQIDTHKIHTNSDLPLLCYLFASSVTFSFNFIVINGKLPQVSPGDGNCTGSPFTLFWIMTLPGENIASSSPIPVEPNIAPWPMVVEQWCLNNDGWTMVVEQWWLNNTTFLFWGFRPIFRGYVKGEGIATRNTKPSIRYGTENHLPLRCFFMVLSSEVLIKSTSGSCVACLEWIIVSVLETIQKGIVGVADNNELAVSYGWIHDSTSPCHQNSHQWGWKFRIFHDITPVISNKNPNPLKEVNPQLTKWVRTASRQDFILTHKHWSNVFATGHCSPHLNMYSIHQYTVYYAFQPSTFWLSWPRPCSLLHSVEEIRWANSTKDLTGRQETMSQF